MRHVPKFAVILSITMAFFAVLPVNSQSKLGKYMFDDNRVFTVYAMNDSNNPVYCAAVGKGTVFKFSDPSDDAKHEITFIEIFPYPENKHEDATKDYETTCTGGVVEFLDANHTHIPLRVHIPSRMYREVGLRIAFGTLTVPFRYLFLEDEFTLVPGSAIGGYVGGQYAIFADMAIIFGGSAGYGKIAHDSDSHDSLALAAFVGVKIGAVVHGGLIIGTDLARESYKFHGEPWISFSLGADLLETFDI